MQRSLSQRSAAGGRATLRRDEVDRAGLWGLALRGLGDDAAGRADPREAGGGLAVFLGDRAAGELEVGLQTDRTGLPDNASRDDGPSLDSDGCAGLEGSSAIGCRASRENGAVDRPRLYEGHPRVSSW